MPILPVLDNGYYIKALLLWTPQAKSFLSSVHLNPTHVTQVLKPL